jgi:hypothetical protein
MSFEVVLEKSPNKSLKKVDTIVFRSGEKESIMEHDNPAKTRQTDHVKPAFAFSQIPVHESALSANGNGTVSVLQSCPKLFSPKSCPYGGACHTCPARIQTKLAINNPGDHYEQEADNVADQIMNSSESSTVSNRLLQGGNMEPAAFKYNARETPSNFQEVLGASGRLVDSATRVFMESHLRHDFSNVRIHTDPHAAEFAKELDARACTVGNHVIFGHNEYSPETVSGRRLLAHELAHVVQQRAHLNSSSVQLVQRQDAATAVKKGAQAQASACANMNLYIHLDLPVVSDRYFKNGKEMDKSAWKKDMETDRKRPNSCECKVSKEIEIKGPNPTINSYLLYTRSPCCSCFAGNVSYDVTIDNARQVGSEAVGKCGGEACCAVNMSTPLSLKVLGYNISGTVSVNGSTYAAGK